MGWGDFLWGYFCFKVGEPRIDAAFRQQPFNVAFLADVEGDGLTDMSEVAFIGSDADGDGEAWFRMSVDGGDEKASKR